MAVKFFASQPETRVGLGGGWGRLLAGERVGNWPGFEFPNHTTQQQSINRAGPPVVGDDDDDDVGLLQGRYLCFSLFID